LNDSINERLKQALEDNRKADVAMPVQESEEIEEDGSDETIAGRERKRGIVTTEDEIEGFFVIKSILRGDIDIKRVHMRDTKSYCGVLLDDNNRKPICRLRFNQEQKYLGLIDEAKREAQNPIVDVDDIYKYAETIRATVKLYDEQFGIPASRQDSAPSAETSVGDAQSSYTGKRVNTVTFKGRRQAVNSWKNAMLALFEALRASDLERFEKVAVTMLGRKRPHITRDASKLRQAQPIAGTELYVEANLSSQMIATLCYGLIAKMGFSASDLAFEIS
jgi:hypothetical protein